MKWGRRSEMGAKGDVGKWRAAVNRYAALRVSITRTAASKAARR